jgi:endoglucanase
MLQDLSRMERSQRPAVLALLKPFLAAYRFIGHLLSAPLRQRAACLGALAAAASLTLSAPAVFAQTTGVPSAGAGAGYWHTSGSRILDANGTQVRIAGINWYGFETTNYLANGLWSQDYKTILNTIKAQGYNVIRIPFSNQLVESNPIPTNYTSYANGQSANTALVGQTALQDLDTIVSYAGSIGLRVILDNHVSEAGGNNEVNGLWYTSAYPQANWLADWKTMAVRYSGSQFTFNGNPTVIGFDLRNEPHLETSVGATGSCWTGDTETNGCPVTNTAQNWPAAAQAAGNAVQAINPNLLIFVEGNDCYNGDCAWEGEMLMGVATHPVVLNVPNQLVYSAHDYGPNLYEQPWFNGNTSQASLNTIFNQYWGYIVSQNIAPVWLGEFGTTNVSTDISSTVPGSQGQWFSGIVSYLQNNPNVNWTYWALNGNDDYGLLDNNWDSQPASAQKQSLLATIQFPLGVATTTPSFTLNSSSSSVTLTQGSGDSFVVAIDGANGFAGNVTLAASGLPSGVTAVFGSNPVSGATIVSFSASSTAPAGTSTVTVSGTSGNLTASTNIIVTVNAKQTPAFTLAASSPAASVAQAAGASDTISVISAGGFNGNVTLAASGLPSGVTAAFSANPTAGNTVLTFAASSTAAAGTSTVTVSGVSGTLTASTAIALTVNATSKPSFTLAASSASIAATQGSSVSDTISVAGAGGFTGSVTLAAPALPPGVTASFGTNPVTGSSLLTFTAASNALAGATKITINGTSGTLTASTIVTLTVNLGACTPPTITPYVQVNGGAWQQTTSISAPAGATVNLGPQASAGTWSWAGPAGFTSAAREIDSIPLTTGVNTYVVTHAASSTCKSTLPFSITVSAPTPSFTLSPSASALSVAPAGSASDTVSVHGVNAFTGAVNLAASGLPAGVTAAFGTNPTTATSVVTFTASSTATAGTYTVTITGKSGSLAASTTLLLTVNPPVATGVACHISYVIDAQWPGGFGAAITIANTGTKPIANWTLTWTFANGQTVSQLWNGSVVQNGSQVAVTNMSYNGTIAAGGTTSLGFNGIWNNSTNAVPASFALNGTACK